MIIHDKVLVLLLQESVAGYVALPYLVLQSGETIFELSERLTMAHVNAWNQEVDPLVKDLVSGAEKYTDQELYRRFCSDKRRYKPSDFLKSLEREKLLKIVRPAVGKAVSEVLFKAREIGLPVFMREDTRSVYLGDVIGFSTDNVQTSMCFKRRDDGIEYQLELYTGNEKLLIRDKHCDLITGFPAWLLYDGRLYSFHKNFEGSKIKPFLTKSSIFIPRRMEQEYFRKYIRKNVRGGNVIAEGFDILDLRPRPVPVLSFEYSPFFNASFVLVFSYSGKRIEASRGGDVIVDLQIEDDAYTFQRVHRDAVLENAVKKQLKETSLHEVAPGVWAPSGDNLPDVTAFVQWINVHASMLEKKEFVLESNFYGSDYYLGSVSIDQSTKAGTDWFDIQMTIVFDDGYKLPFLALRENILNGNREYVRDDGVVFIIPEEWFSEYLDLCELAKVKDKRFRIRRSFYPVFSDKGWEMPEADISGEDDDFALPTGLKATLRPYQIEGFRWMKRLTAAGYGGCLADDMGLGKTIQVISFLLSKKQNSSTSQNTPVTDSQLSLFETPDMERVSMNPSLIVMPASLIHNWMAEVWRFAPEMKVYRHTGVDRKVDAAKFSDYHIIVTTYGTLRNDIEKISSYTFSSVILDESQVIKNPDSKTHRAVMRLKAESRFVLSGTPVENSLLDLWAQLEFVQPGLLGERELFKRVFLRPIGKNGNEERLEKLRRIVSPFVLRRTKKQVAKELPEKMEQVLYCDMPEEQRSVYEEEKSKVRNELILQLAEDPAPNVKFAVLQALTRLRQIACHPSLAKDVTAGVSGKFQTILQHVETVAGEGHKILMFSSFVEHLRLFENEFREMNIRYSMLTGSTVNREEVISQFRTDPQIPVFLISLKAGGVGLNLTEADYVFMLDPWWNPAAENQAIDRTHRIGQHRNVFVYRFISKGTIEEKMLALQQQKSKLAEEVIHAGENPVFSMSKQELENLIK